MEYLEKHDEKVVVRGNVVSEATGSGLKSVSIEVVGEKQEDNKSFQTSDFGLFLFELDNSKMYKIFIKQNGYFSEELTIPKGLRSIYFPVLLKPKK